jgi:hypothetical protein
MPARARLVARGSRSSAVSKRATALGSPIVAPSFLRRIGIDWPQSLQVIAFANAPEAAKFVTSRYSLRLLTDYGPPPDWQGVLQKAGPRIDVIAGESDELMDAAAYQSVLPPLGVHVVVLPNVDHMGVVCQPAALAAILEITKS